MEYFIWDKHYSFSYFMDLKFDKLIRTVAYSSSHHLSGRRSQTQDLGVWDFRRGGWAAPALLGWGILISFWIHFCLTSESFILESPGTFKNLKLHGDNSGWLIVVIHIKCKTYEVGELCEITLLCPIHWDDLCEWLVHCVTPNLKYVSCYFHSSHMGSELFQHSMTLTVKAKATAKLHARTTGNQLGNSFPIEAESSEDSILGFPCLVWKKWCWNKPCLQTREEVLTGHILIFCQDYLEDLYNLASEKEQSNVQHVIEL